MGKKLSTLSAFLVTALGWQLPVSARSFTYQGQLKQGGVPVSEPTAMRFSLWSTASHGLVIGSAIEVDPLDVVNGLFQVDLDFGIGAFDGNPRWLQIELKDSFGSYFSLEPRQPINPAPYALFALNAPVVGGDGWWAANGDDIHSLHNGRLGIRTTSPRQHLSIGNNLDLYSGGVNNPTRPSIRGSAANNLVLNASQDGAVFINHDGGTGGVRFHAGASGADNELMRLTNDGRLGIGVADPLHRLHITGPNNISMVYAENNWITIRGIHTASGTFPGVQGETNSTSNDAAGVRGFINSTTPGARSAGVWGRNFGTAANGYGIRGSHEGNGVGIFGEASGSSGWAGYFEGRVRVIGNDSGSGIESSGTISASRAADAPGPGGLFSRSTTAGGTVLGPSYRTEIDGREIDAYSRDSVPPFAIGPVSLRLNSNSSGDVTLASGGGNVGVGVSSPNSRLHVNVPSGNHALRVQIGGATKLLVASTGGVSVGANVTTPPTNGLHVAGDAHVSGVLDIGIETIAEFCNNSLTCTAQCPPGKVALGGGCSAHSCCRGVSHSEPIPNAFGGSSGAPTGWYCEKDSSGIEDSPGATRAWVICARAK